MNVVVVSDLCTAFGELIDQDPKVAASVAKKLGAVLLRQHELEEERSAQATEDEKLSDGRRHELQQREFDLREQQLVVEAERVKVEAAEAEAAAARR